MFQDIAKYVRQWIEYHCYTFVQQKLSTKMHLYIVRAILLSDILPTCSLQIFLRFRPHLTISHIPCSSRLSRILSFRQFLELMPSYYYQLLLQVLQIYFIFFLEIKLKIILYKLQFLFQKCQNDIQYAMNVMEDNHFIKIFLVTYHEGCTLYQIDR